VVVSRGEVYLAAMPNQTKPRPAIVLTPDWLSRHAPDIGWAKCDQVTTIPKDLLLGKAFGRLTAGKMRAIEDAVRLGLGI
jgi:mRNA-degrading endonuclease toxin of MazEF toxin-antitoxin module